MHILNISINILYSIIRNNNQIDSNYIIDKYLKNDNWSFKENSTVSYSIGDLMLFNNTAITSNY